VSTRPVFPDGLVRPQAWDLKGELARGRISMPEAIDVARPHDV
jgi:hypothetical protein